MSEDKPPSDETAEQSAAAEEKPAAEEQKAVAEEQPAAEEQKSAAAEAAHTESASEQQRSA